MNATTFAFMRAVLLFLALLAGLAPVAAAETAAGGAPPRLDLLSDYERAQVRLDELFDKLKHESNAREAERLARQVWDQWGVSGSATIDLMMGWARDAMDEKRYDVALDFLDQVVTMAPGYAEGWNRRATVHFIREDYAKSMADIERVLELEPRHFGAMAGMGAIFKTIGKDALALRAFENVLDVYPMNRAAQEQVGTLSDELAGEAI